MRYNTDTCTVELSVRELCAMAHKSGSLDAAAIIHDGAIICRDSLRYGNEVVRHKILDMVGDLYLCGCRVKGTVIAIKPGHPRNVELAGQLEQAIAGAKQQQECAK